MMKKQKILYKKIRGRNKILRHFEAWKQQNLKLNLEFINKYHYDYVKLRIRPWADLQINSVYPEPKGEYLEIFISSLVEIYFSWKEQLDQLGVKYYLKIWINYPNLCNSQVVCAIDERINHYEEDIWFKPENNCKLPNFTHSINDLLNDFTWDYRIDEREIIPNEELGCVTDWSSLSDYSKYRKWLRKFISNPDRKEVALRANGDKETRYFVKLNDVWIGECKSNP